MAIRLSRVQEPGGDGAFKKRENVYFQKPPSVNGCNIL